MDIQNVLNFVKENSGISFAIAIGVFMAAAALANKVGFHLWYIAVLAAAALFSILSGHPLYFWPFMLGMLTAFAEIISKFDDEPMKALRTTPALLYHIMNGLIAVFALYFLALLAGIPADFAGVGDMDELKYALSAGLGAMLVMRSKLFNIKMGEEDVSFGPEQIIKILFRFMESAIGRVRARDRRQVIEKNLNNINFDKVYAHSVMTLQRASRAFSPEQIRNCLEDLERVRTCGADTQLKSYELGYVIYDNLGEDFVTDFFSNRGPEWQIRAISPEEAKEEAKNDSILPNKIAEIALAKAIPFVGPEVSPYMAYGANMSSARILERLNWLDAAGKQSLDKTRPVKCELKDYRLEFNKKSPDRPYAEALANIVKAEGAAVEGVLYQLPKEALDFLAQSERGYSREKVKVIVGGKPTDAEVFIADKDEVVPGLRPSPAELASMIAGAEEHKLNEGYKSGLKKFQGADAVMAGKNGEKMA